MIFAVPRVNATVTSLSLRTRRLIKPLMYSFIELLYMNESVQVRYCRKASQLFTNVIVELLWLLR